MSDSVERSDALTAREAALGGPEQMVDSLRRGVARQGRSLVLLTVSMIVDIALSVVLAVAVIHLNSVANLAARNAAAARSLNDASYQTCLSSNRARAAETALWDHVLDTPSSQRLSVAQAAARRDEIASLKSYVAAKLAPRTCTKGHA